MKMVIEMNSGMSEKQGRQHVRAIKDIRKKVMKENAGLSDCLREELQKEYACFCEKS